MVGYAPITPTAIVDHVRRAGGSLWIDGDRLHISMPRGRLTPRLVAMVREQKPGIVKLIADPPPMTDDVRARVVAFDKLLTDWDQAGRPAAPPIALPGTPPWRPGRCISCGDAVQHGRRCAPCTAALQIILALEAERMQGF